VKVLLKQGVIILSKIPPEKYYEACITHHLVNEFDTQLDIKLYPFSISQIEENDRGFDFGYEFDSYSFFIQYKKPHMHEIETKKTAWKINIDQLKTIRSNDIGLRTFYVLPGFTNTSEWYDGLDQSYFVDAARLYNHNIGKLMQKTTTLNSDSEILRHWSYYFNINIRKQSNTALRKSTGYKLTSTDIIEYINQLDHMDKDSMWLYLIKKEF